MCLSIRPSPLLTQPQGDPALNPDARRPPIYPPNTRKVHASKSTCTCACPCARVCVCQCVSSKFALLLRADIAVSTTLPNCFRGYWSIAVVTASSGGWGSLCVCVCVFVGMGGMCGTHPAVCFSFCLSHLCLSARPCRFSGSLRCYQAMD